MAKTIPIGNPNNINSWRSILKPEQVARVNQRSHTDIYEDKHGIIRDLGQSTYDKVVKKRYDWLFDDLQRFTSIKPDSIETKEDLKAFVEATIGKSKGFLSMEENNPRRYQNSISRAVNSLWSRHKGDVVTVARTNVVEEVKEDRASLVAERIKSDKSKRKALSDARLGNLYLVRREQVVAKRVDRRGRIFHINLMTGRRSRNPAKILAELGFKD